MFSPDGGGSSSPAANVDKARRNQTLLVRAIRFALVCLVCCLNKFCSQAAELELVSLLVAFSVVVDLQYTVRWGREFVPTKHPIGIPFRDGQQTCMLLLPMENDK